MIQIKNLGCTLGEFSLSVDVTVNDGEYFIILGPNGAGKTVLLETIAGFNRADRGSVLFNEREIQNMPPEKRGIGIVYQDDALFPHLSVLENVVYGLKARKMDRREISDVIDWVTEITDISSLLSRKPLTLSGGERRKVALARALSIKPEVLLLDEPLSALDPEVKERTTVELMKIHNLLHLTTIHVCHDFAEAFTLGTRIAVMNEGRIYQVGTPEQIFRQPNSEFVARFTMTRNIFEGEVGYDDRGLLVFRMDGAELRVIEGTQNARHTAIRPEDISISLKPVTGDDANCLAGEITRIIDNGSALHVTVSTPAEYVCEVSRRLLEEMKLEQQKRVFIVFAPASVSLF